MLFDRSPFDFLAYVAASEERRLDSSSMDPDLVELAARGLNHLDLELTAAAAERLRNVTAGNIGRPLVIMFDAEVVGAPTIRSEIGGRGQVAVPASSSEEAGEIIAQIRDRWPPE